MNEILEMMHKATDEMRAQKGERVESKLARRVSEVVSGSNLISDYRWKMIREIKDILDDDIWYTDKPVVYKPVKWAIILQGGLYVVQFIDAHSTFDIVGTEGVTFDEQSDSIERPATTDEVNQFYKEWTSK